MGTLGRSGKRYLALCARVRARAKRNGEVCCLCTQPIDWDAPPRTRWSFSVEHVTSLVNGGGLLDEANAQPAHFGCNARRGGMTRAGREPVVLRTSRPW